VGDSGGSRRRWATARAVRLQAGRAINPSARKQQGALGATAMHSGAVVCWLASVAAVAERRATVARSVLAGAVVL
jgi:hypothetical protein